MKKLFAALFACAISLSIIFIGSESAPASPNMGTAAGQVVHKTKRISRKVYRRGRHGTVVTYRRGKKVTKKVWHKGHRITSRTIHKTKRFIMGPKTRKP